MSQMNQHILVDFENVQPSAADIRLVQGANLQLWIFRGPAQEKYSAEVAEAWQPLGDRVHFVACAKAGRNAVDMHIALAIGRLLGEARDASAQKSMRFTVVSKDTDFDPLLLHVRGLGCTANRVATLKAAVGAVGKTEEAPKAKPAAKKAAAKKPAKKAAVKQAAAKQAAPPKQAVPPPAPLEGAAQKVIESLRRMGEKRPAKRKGLERHIESHLGRKLAPNTVEEIVAALERDRVLTFTDKKVEYSLPKAKK
jgi:hypothetical protein